MLWRMSEEDMSEHWPYEEYDSLRITDCYVYGPSIRNVRIEGLWRQQRYTTTGPWISYFKLLSLSGPLACRLCYVASSLRNEQAEFTQGLLSCKLGY